MNITARQWASQDSISQDGFGGWMALAPLFSRAMAPTRARFSRGRAQKDATIVFETRCSWHAAGPESGQYPIIEVRFRKLGGPIRPKPILSFWGVFSHRPREVPEDPCFRGFLSRKREPGAACEAVRQACPAEPRRKAGGLRYSRSQATADFSAKSFPTEIFQLGGTLTLRGFSPLARAKQCKNLEKTPLTTRHYHGILPTMAMATRAHDPALTARVPPRHPPPQHQHEALHFLRCELEIGLEGAS